MFIINCIIALAILAAVVVCTFILGFQFCMGYIAIEKRDIERSAIAKKEAEIGSWIIKNTM